MQNEPTVNCSTNAAKPQGGQYSCPRELRELAQWVGYKLTLRPRHNKPDELNKTPYSTQTGIKASHSNPATWSTFEQAMAAFVTRTHRLDGVGFVFTEDDPYLGIDLDKCRDKATGEIAAWAQAIIALLDSYTEVSPSGTGVHIIVRAPGLVHGIKRKYGSEVGVVELYSTERFFTVTGQHLDGTPTTIEERSEQVIKVRAMIGEKPDAPLSADGRYAEPTCGVTSLADEQVLRHCRSDSGGELFKAVYDDGDLGDFEYDDSAADWYVWGKLAFYIGADPARIARIAEQGAHYRHPDDSTLAEERRAKWQRQHPVYGTFQQWQIAARLATLGIDGVYGAARTKPSEKAKAWPAPLADAAYYGVLGDIAKGIEPFIETDLGALMVNLLVVSGIAIGRDPHLEVGAAQHHGVLYTVTVGETGENKSDNTNPIRQVMENVPPTAYANDGYDVGPIDDLGVPPAPTLISGLSTGEGLLWQVRDRREEIHHDKKTHVDELVVTDAGVLDKRLLVMESEFGRVLSVMYREGNTLSAVMRDLFDSPAVARTSPKNNAVIASEPHIGLIGQITPDELRRKLREGESYNGFMGRFLWVVTHRVKSLPSPPNYSLKVREHAQWWGDAIRRARNIRSFRRDHRADAQWVEQYELLRRGGRPGLPERKGAALDVTARGHVMVLRMALIFAAMDGSDVITTAHQDAALAVWDYCERCAAYLFGDVSADPIENTISDALQREGRMRREQLLALFSRHQATASIQLALDALQRAGRVRSSKEQTSGRPIEWWQWVGE